MLYREKKKPIDKNYETLSPRIPKIKAQRSDELHRKACPAKEERRREKDKRQEKQAEAFELQVSASASSARFEQAIGPNNVAWN